MEIDILEVSRYRYLKTLGLDVNTINKHKNYRYFISMDIYIENPSQLDFFKN